MQLRKKGAYKTRSAKCVAGEIKLKRLLIIRNPAAGQRRASRYAKAVRLLEEARCVMTVCVTAARGDAERIAREADPEAFDAVVAAGGDGTINEVANGLAGKNLPLGVIPLGTANVLAHEIGVGSGIPRAVETLLSGRPQAVSAASAGGRLCCLMASVGYDARAVARVRLGFKGLAGQAAYYLAGLEEVLSGTRHMFSVEVDGKLYQAASVIVMNGRLYGGRFVCAPEADLRDPELYAVLMTRPGRLNILRYGLALIASRLHRLPDVEVIPARKVRILSPAGEPCQSDGDLIGKTPIDVTVRENPLEILYPPDFDGRPAADSA